MEEVMEGWQGVRVEVRLALNATMAAGNLKAGIVSRVESGCVWLDTNPDDEDEFVVVQCSHIVWARVAS